TDARHPRPAPPRPPPPRPLHRWRGGSLRRRSARFATAAIRGRCRWRAPAASAARRTASVPAFLLGRGGGGCLLVGGNDAADERVTDDVFVREDRVAD